MASARTLFPSTQRSTATSSSANANNTISSSSNNATETASDASTATTMASTRRKIRLAGSRGGNNHPNSNNDANSANHAVIATNVDGPGGRGSNSMTGANGSSNRGTDANMGMGSSNYHNRGALSPAARRRLIRHPHLHPGVSGGAGKHNGGNIDGNSHGNHDNSSANCPQHLNLQHSDAINNPRIPDTQNNHNSNASNPGRRSRMQKAQNRSRYRSNKTQTLRGGEGKNNKLDGGDISTDEEVDAPSNESYNNNNNNNKNVNHIAGNTGRNNTTNSATTPNRNYNYHRGVLRRGKTNYSNRRGESRQDVDEGHSPIPDSPHSPHSPHTPDPNPNIHHPEPKLNLNLAISHSVDSDDNGTCFNSIGTTTPRNPQGYYNHGHLHHPHGAHEHTKDEDVDVDIEQHQPHLHRDLRVPNVTSTSGRHRLLPTDRRVMMNYHSDGINNGNTNTQDSSNHMYHNQYDKKLLSPLLETSPRSDVNALNGGNDRKNISNVSDIDMIGHGNDGGGGHSSPDPNGNLHRKNGKDSIWDHPEEMVSSRYNNQNSNSNGGGSNVNNNGNNSAGGGGDNASIYSEYDNADGCRGPSADGHRHPNSNASTNGGRIHRNQQQQQPRGRTNRIGGGASVTSKTSIASSKYGDDDGTLEKMMKSSRAHQNRQRNHYSRSGKGVSDTEEEDEGVDEIMNKPNVKAALGVGAAATLGAVILGPVGLLVGAASAGIGMGVMQIPEEHRNNVFKSASSSLEKVRGYALDLSDNCGKIYGEEMGAANPELHQELVDRCCSVKGEDKRRGAGGDDLSLPGTEAVGPEIRSQGSSPMASAMNGVGHGVKGLVGDVFGDDHTSPSHSIGERNEDIMAESDDVGRRVACGRKGRVVPLSQIHSLRPSLQPRAWLDVMASAHTSRNDKNEAMEEILILAKDKDISRWFLEEGILDSLMYILSNYFRNYSSFLRDELPIGETQESFTSFKPGGEAFFHAKLAANCCVALGKAHCAAVHTEGDLLLMSAYSRGSVPVERQLAQMLFEVPHHMKVMNPVQNNGTNDNQFDAEHFTLTELSMQQAEDLASSIKALDDGKIDV